MLEQYQVFDLLSQALSAKTSLETMADEQSKQTAYLKRIMDAQERIADAQESLANMQKKATRLNEVPNSEY